VSALGFGLSTILSTAGVDPGSEEPSLTTYIIDHDTLDAMHCFRDRRQGGGAMTTAAAIIIGDEILGAKFEDRNGPWLIPWLRGRGLELRQLAYLPDDPQLIAATVASFAARYDWVFTSGGVGPTHDDVTFAAVAEGMGRPLTRHPELVRVLEERWLHPVTDAALRMTDVPAGAALWWEGEIAYPVVVVENVVVLPGLPRLFRAKLEAVAHRFEGELPQQRCLCSSAHESAFADALAVIAGRYPALRIGSYPRTEPDQAWRVQLVLEGRDPEGLAACEAELRALLGDSLVACEEPLGQA
jgi:molybdenum cofactor synthesis domain-containing protein